MSWLVSISDTIVNGNFSWLTRRHGIKVGAGFPRSVEEVGLAVGEVVGHGSVRYCGAAHRCGQSGSVEQSGAASRSGWDGAREQPGPDCAVGGDNVQVGGNEGFTWDTDSDEICVEDEVGESEVSGENKEKTG